MGLAYKIGLIKPTTLFPASSLLVLISVITEANVGVEKLVP